MDKRQAKWHVRAYRLSVILLAVGLFVFIRWSGYSLLPGLSSESGEGRRRLINDSLEEEVRRWPNDLFTDESLFNGAYWFHFLGMLYTFFGIAIVCDEFFVPALEVIVERLDLAHDVAGATFMAAGGSAPELFTSLVGTFISKSQVGFGTIVGSAVFNVLFVIGMCAIFSTGQLKLTWWPFARDVMYYGFSLFILTMFFGVNSAKVIELWETIALLGMYGLYVFLMYFNEQLHEWFLLKIGAKSIRRVPMGKFRVGLLQLLKSLDDQVSIIDVVGAYMIDKIAGNVESTFKKIDKDGNGCLDREEIKEALMKLGVPKDKVDEDVDDLIRSADENNDGQIQLDEFKSWYMTQKSRTRDRIDKLFKRFDKNENGYIDRKELRAMLTAVNGAQPTVEFSAKAYADMKPDSKKGVNFEEFSEWYKKTLFKSYRRSDDACADLKTRPSDSMLEVSVVDGQKTEDGDQNEDEDNEFEDMEDDDDDPLDISYPKYGGWKSKLRWALTIPIIFPLWVTLFDVRNEKYKKYYWVTFAGSMVWLGIFSCGMVWWATIVGWCWNIPSTVMGITFIAAGTSVPDLLTSVIVARQGYADMAVSSSIGSNIFDILIGLPFPWLCWCLSSGESVQVGDGDTSLAQSILVLFGMLFAVFITVVFNKWVMTRALGYTMFVLYIVFLIQYLLTVHDLWG